MDSLHPKVQKRSEQMERVRRARVQHCYYMLQNTMSKFKACFLSEAEVLHWNDPDVIRVTEKAQAYLLSFPNSSKHKVQRRLCETGLANTIHMNGLTTMPPNVPWCTAPCNNSPARNSRFIDDS